MTHHKELDKEGSGVDKTCKRLTCEAIEKDVKELRIVNGNCYKITHVLQLLEAEG